MELSEIQQHAAKLGWIEGELAREHHRYAAVLAESTTVLIEHYEPLAELGQAVLDEHRAALAYERDLTDPALRNEAQVTAARTEELLQGLL